jgi:hypothetical protein
LMTQAELDEYCRHDKVRRSEGQEIADSFTGDARTENLKHHCKRDLQGLWCCQSREQAVTKCQSAARLPLKKRLGTPAVNRWIL